MPRLPAIAIWAWCLAFAAILFGIAMATAEERARSLWWNSLVLGASTAAIAVPIGTILALLVGRCELPGRTLAISLLAFALFLPLYLHAAAWQAGFGTQGWFTIYLWPSGIEPPLIGWRGTITIHSIVAIPWVVLLVSSGLTHARPEPEEAALLEGGSLGSLVYVTLPLLAPPIALAALWVIVATIGEMTVSDLFAVRVIAEEVYLSYARDDLREVKLAMLPALAGIGCLVLSAAIVAANVAPWEAPVREPRRWKLGSFHWPAVVAVLLFVGLLVAVPLANLAAKGGWLVVGSGEERTRTWSPVALARVVAETPARDGEELGWSLSLGAAAATIALSFSLWSWWARRGGWPAGGVLAVAAIGLALPGPFIGWGLIRIFNDPHLPWLNEFYDRGPLVPMLAQTVRALPLVLLLVWQAFASLPREIEELAALDGAGAGSFAASIVLPSRWPALVCAWIAGLAVAMGDLAGSVLVKPPGVNTVSWLIFERIHSGVDDQLAGLCIVWSAIFAAITAAALACYQWQLDENRRENFAADRSASISKEGL